MTETSGKGMNATVVRAGWKRGKVNYEKLSLSGPSMIEVDTLPAFLVPHRDPFTAIADNSDYVFRQAVKKAVSARYRTLRLSFLATSKRLQNV